MARIKRTEKQEELLREYRREMKVANERLRQLEKLAQNPKYENVLQYAYRNASRDVKELGIGDLEKVRYRIPTNTNKLESALRRVKEFNAMPTSKKSTIDVVYKQSAVNFNRSFGTNFTWQEVKTFTDAVDWEKLKAERGSATLQKVIKSIMKNGVTPKDIEDANARHKTISGMDSVTSDWTKRLIDEGLDVSMLHSGTADFVPDYANESPFID